MLTVARGAPATNRPSLVQAGPRCRHTARGGFTPSGHSAIPRAIVLEADQLRTGCAGKIPANAAVPGGRETVHDGTRPPLASGLYRQSLICDTRATIDFDPHWLLMHSMHAQSNQRSGNERRRGARTPVEYTKAPDSVEPSGARRERFARGHSTAADRSEPLAPSRRAGYEAAARFDSSSWRNSSVICSVAKGLLK